MTDPTLMLATAIEKLADSQAVLAERLTPTSSGRRTGREAVALAVLAVIESPGLSQRKAAEAAGCDPRTLRNSETWRRFFAAASQPTGELPAGFRVAHDGRLTGDFDGVS